MRAPKTKTPPPLIGRTEAGSAAIEFALSIPVFIILLMGTVELGAAAWEAMLVRQATEAGVVYAAKNGWDQTGITNAVLNASPGKGVTATPPPSQYYGCPSDAGITPTTQGATCTGGSPPGYYIKINASITHHSIWPGSTMVLPATFNSTSITRLN